MTQPAPQPAAAANSALGECLSPFCERTHLVETVKQSLGEHWEKLSERDREALLHMFARLAELRTRRLFGTAGPAEQALEASFAQNIISVGMGLTAQTVNSTIDKYLARVASFIEVLINRLKAGIPGL